jgi:hypothetical protein
MYSNFAALFHYKLKQQHPLAVLHRQEGHKIIALAYTIAY